MLTESLNIFKMDPLLMPIVGKAYIIHITPKRDLSECPCIFGVSTPRHFESILEPPQLP